MSISDDENGAVFIYKPRISLGHALGLALYLRFYRQGLCKWKLVRHCGKAVALTKVKVSVLVSLRSPALMDLGPRL